MHSPICFYYFFLAIFTALCTGTPQEMSKNCGCHKVFSDPAKAGRSVPLPSARCFVRCTLTYLLLSLFFCLGDFHSFVDGGVRWHTPQEMPKNCCGCRMDGSCTNCKCVKEQRACTNCYASREGKCTNSFGTVAREVGVPFSGMPLWD